MFPSMTEDFVSRVNEILHVGRDLEKWKAITTYTHDGDGSLQQREKYDNLTLLS